MTDESLLPPDWGKAPPELTNGKRGVASFCRLEHAKYPGYLDLLYYFESGWIWLCHSGDKEQIVATNTDLKASPPKVTTNVLEEAARIFHGWFD